MRRLGFVCFGLVSAASLDCSSGSSGSGGTGGGIDGGAGGSSADAGGMRPHNPLTQALIDRFVTAHDQARSGPLNPTPAPALPPVTWDAVLADSAYGYLVKCVSTASPPALVDHNAGRTSDYQALGGSGYVGENIFGTTGSATAAGALSAWMAEASQYDYNTGAIGTAGHYTQVVWRASVHIGCAIVDCPNLTFHDTVLCDYAPGGNIEGQKPY
jgi:hypothetical protein